MPRMPSTRSAGYAVVEPAPTPRMVRGPSMAESVGNAADAMGKMVSHRMDRQVDQQERDVRDSRKELSDQLTIERQEAREQRAERQRTGRLKAGNAVLDLELEVTTARTDLDDQLARGQIRPDEYEGKLQQHITEKAGALRQGLDPETHTDFDMALQRPVRAALLGAKSSLKAHGKREAAAELDKGRESLLRLAGGDLPRALQMGEALYSKEGPYAAAIGIDAAQKQGQSFRETATRAHYLRRFSDSQNSGASLAKIREEVSTNTVLDPAQQAGLLGSIDSRLGLLENRAQGAAERHLKKQEQAFKALQDLDAQGLPLDAAFLDQTMATLKGSPLLHSAAALVQGSAETAGFGAKPVKEQDAILQAEYAKAREKGVDPASSKRLQKLTGIRNAQEAAIKADPWRAANERGAIDVIPPVLVDSLQNLGTSLAARMELAPTIDRMAGKTVSPLRPEEADVMADTLSALPIPERTKFLGKIQEAIGPERMRAVAEQMKAKNGTLGIAAAYQAQGMKTQSGANLGELVLKGAEARKNKTVKIDERAGEGLEAQIRKQLDGAYATPGATDAAVEATMNVYAGLASGGQGVDAEKAVRIATGGVTEHNGQKIPMPYGWDARQVKRSIASITPEYVQQQAGGNAPIWVGPGRQMLPEDVARILPHAQLRSAGPGRYAIRIGENLLTVDGRKPFTIALPEVK